jgi:predicted alpha/beta superfamily hydrolase
MRAGRLLLLFALVGSTSVAARDLPVDAYSVPGSNVRIMTARRGADYRIMIWQPQAPPPAAGYPVLYVLDGDDNFAIAAETANRLGRFAQASGITPGLVVAIGYPGANRRAYDYTPPFARGAPPQQADRGGADAFLAFIQNELRPAIARAHRVDPARQAILGHSFGGLFVLHAMFTRPDLFQIWIAASPSIWFGDRAVLSGEAGFAERLRRTGAPARLYLSVGGLEQSAPVRLSGPRATEMATRNAERRMVDNARELAGRLVHLEADSLSVRFRVFPGEGHGTSVLPAIGDAIQQAFGEVE